MKAKLEAFGNKVLSGLNSLNPLLKLSQLSEQFLEKCPRFNQRLMSIYFKCDSHTMYKNIQ